MLARQPQWTGSHGKRIGSRQHQHGSGYAIGRVPASRLAEHLRKPFLLNPAPAVQLPRSLLERCTLLTVHGGKSRPGRLPSPLRYQAVFNRTGSERMRFPVTAKIALVSAGMTGGNAGSPRPVGALSDFTHAISICGAA